MSGWPASRERVLDALQGQDVASQRVVHQDGRFALGLQAVEHAQRARHLAREHRLAELEHVVARDIEHRGLDLLERELARAVQQTELGDLLLRREQIALDLVGEVIEISAA